MRVYICSASVCTLLVQVSINILSIDNQQQLFIKKKNNNSLQTLVLDNTQLAL